MRNKINKKYYKLLFICNYNETDQNIFEECIV